MLDHHGTVHYQPNRSISSFHHKKRPVNISAPTSSITSLGDFVSVEFPGSDKLKQVEARPVQRMVATGLLGFGDRTNVALERRLAVVRAAIAGEREPEDRTRLF